MNTRERGILIGLAVVLAAGTAFIVIKAREQRAQGGASSGGRIYEATDPSTWDVSRLPSQGKVLSSFKTPGGVLVQVLKEGRGEPVTKDHAMDLHYTGYSAVSGAIFERGMYPGLILKQGGVIPGWLEGLEGIRLREKRRLLIPSAMAYGSRRQGNITPNSDLVFDVEWVQLDIDDLKEGSGAVAKRGSKVMVHYKGELENGSVFDSSYTRDKPFDFTLGKGQVIKGWDLGVAGMKVGGVRKLWIPWHLAYAKQAKKGIPGYSNLIFTVELLAVE